METYPLRRLHARHYDDEQNSAQDSYLDMSHSRTRLGVGKECCNFQNLRKPLTSLFAFVCNLAESLHHKDTFFHSHVSPSYSVLRDYLTETSLYDNGSALGVCIDALHALLAHAQLHTNCGTSIMCTRRSCDAFLDLKTCNLSLITLFFLEKIL
jgi:hypothetical protein